MALRKCYECGTEVSSKAAACPKCGAKVKKKTSMFTWVVVGLIGLGGILPALFSTSDRPTSPSPGAGPVAARTSANSASAVAPAAQAVAVVPVATAIAASPASAVASAEALIKRSKAGDAWGRSSASGKSVPMPEGGLITKVEWAECKARLTAVDKGAPEFVKAQALLKAMAAIDARDAAYMATVEAKAQVERRKIFATKLEHAFIESRMNADVAALGPQATTLRIKYVLASKVTANDLGKSGVLEKAESAGFKVVQFTDGYDSTWTWKF